MSAEEQQQEDTGAPREEEPAPQPQEQAGTEPQAAEVGGDNSNDAEQTNEAPEKEEPKEAEADTNDARADESPAPAAAKEEEKEEKKNDDTQQKSPEKSQSKSRKSQSQSQSKARSEGSGSRQSESCTRAFRYVRRPSIPKAAAHDAEPHEKPTFVDLAAKDSKGKFHSKSKRFVEPPKKIDVDPTPGPSMADAVKKSRNTSHFSRVTAPRFVDPANPYPEREMTVLPGMAEKATKKGKEHPSYRNKGDKWLTYKPPQHELNAYCAPSMVDSIKKDRRGKLHSKAKRFKTPPRFTPNVDPYSLPGMYDAMIKNRNTSHFSRVTAPRFVGVKQATIMDGEGEASRSPARGQKNQQEEPAETAEA